LEKRKIGRTKEYVRRGSPDRHKEVRLQQEGAWEKSPGQKTLED